MVSGILTYGLFITFNGLEGLVHVSEIDWGHVNDPSKFAKVGDKVTVQVIGIDADKISLSMKRLKANPWQVLAEKYKVGDVIEAPVMRISQFGVFLSLSGGISGLIHLSEISHDMVKEVGDYAQVGENVKAKIITFDPIAKRIGLSMKALEEAPVVEVPKEKKKEKTTEKKVAKKKEEAAPKEEKEEKVAVVKEKKVTKKKEVAAE